MTLEEMIVNGGLKHEAMTTFALLANAVQGARIALEGLESSRKKTTP